jgi:uncharacterized protein (TIGR02599 family)
VIPRWRGRLMEYMQPTEQFSLYAKSDGSYAWFTTLLEAQNPPSHVLAENILTLIILPKLAKADEDYRASTESQQAAYLSPYYVYDSYPVGADGKAIVSPLNPGASAGSDGGMICPKNQLPPILMVTMIAVDERSAERLSDKYVQSPLLGMDKVTNNAGVAYNTLFSNLITNPLEGSTGDLAKYEQALVKEGITYRIFTSNVSIKGAKWSRVQTK